MKTTFDWDAHESASTRPLQAVFRLVWWPSVSAVRLKLISWWMSIKSGDVSDLKQGVNRDRPTFCGPECNHFQTRSSFRPYHDALKISCWCFEHSTTHDRAISPNGSPKTIQSCCGNSKGITPSKIIFYSSPILVFGKPYSFVAVEPDSMTLIDNWSGFKVAVYVTNDAR